MSSNPSLVVIEDKILAVFKYFEMFYLNNICTFLSTFVHLYIYLNNILSSHSTYRLQTLFVFKVM